MSGCSAFVIFVVCVDLKFPAGICQSQLLDGDAVDVVDLNSVDVARDLLLYF
jgi:hypothetical protein